MEKYLQLLIFRKVLITLALSAGILLISILYWIVQGDHTLLTLSIVVSVFSIIRAVGYIKKYLKNQVEGFEGVCESITQKPFGKNKCITLITSNENKVVLWVPKHTKLKRGLSYRLYYWQRPSIGIDSLDAKICSDMFLGHVPIAPIEQ